MRLRLFLLFASTLLVGIGTAHAQCFEGVILFPPSGRPVQVASGTCLSTVGEQGRLRWDNNHSGELQLFDTDDTGAVIWCAGQDTGGCVSGQSFCLKEDGNAVIMSGPSCTGTKLWESGTFGQNICGEGIGARDIGGGERAVIVNHLNCGSLTMVWSRGDDD